MKKMFIKRKEGKSTAFADFMNSASSGEKKKVYKTVLEKASNSQKKIVVAAQSMQTAG